MPDLLSQVKDVPNAKVALVRSLQSSGRPVLLYGAGSYAVDVIRFLRNHGIAVAAACVDQPFVDRSQGRLGEIPVLEASRALQMHADCPVLIAVSDYVRARRNLRDYGREREVDFIDAPNHLEFLDYQYVRDRADEFEETYRLLEDTRSREVYTAFLNAKVSGDPTPLYQLSSSNQYFGEPVRLTDSESLVDCGAFDGDTLRSFVKATRGHYRRIFCIEPNPLSFEKLLRTVSDLQAHDVVPVCAGAWSSEGKLRFAADANTGSIVEQRGDSEIDVLSVDQVVSGEQITMIKMDIEGAELEALKGAASSIQESHPCLAICVYHKPDDLIEIPRYIRSLREDYRFYLRHHQFLSWEMVLYGIPITIDR